MFSKIRLNNLIYYDFPANVEAPVNCTDGDIRLYDGSSENEGILQVCSNMAWTTVCYNYYWRDVDTKVVCSELGYTIYGIDI